MQNSETNAKCVSETFKYPECRKGGYHIGEIMNLVCIQSKCIENCILCGICYDEEHKHHKIKPLKMVIQNAKNYLQQLKPMNIDVDKIKTMIQDDRNKALKQFEQFNKFVTQSMESIKENINTLYLKVIEQIDLKAGSNEELIQALNELKIHEIDYDNFTKIMQKLLAGVPLETIEDDENQMSAKEIEQSIKTLQVKLQADMQKKQSKMKKQIEAYLNNLKKLAESPGIFDSKIQFKFSQQLHHTGVQVVTDTLIKSIEAYNYHFALMQPSIQERGNKPLSVAFKIKQNISNWLAVGLCHKNIVQANSFNFNYSQLGHGAYMISSNAGSWSSIDSTKNNVVTSFNFYKGDVIIVNYNPTENNILFKKKGTEQSHTLEFQVKDDDELYLCGLFYYNNDEIEYLGYDDQK